MSIINWLFGIKRVPVADLKPGDKIRVGFLQYTVQACWVNNVGTWIVEVPGMSMGCNDSDTFELIK